MTPFLAAVKYSHIEVVDQFPEKGLHDSKETTSGGSNSIIETVVSGNLRVLNEMVELGADVHAQNCQA